MTSRAGILLISLFFSILLSFLMDSPWTVLKWLDAVFLIGLFLLMASAVMALIEGRFFDAFVHSTKNFFAKVNKKEQLIRESERRQENLHGYARSFPIRKSLFFAGLLMSLFGFILSAALYYS